MAPDEPKKPARQLSAEIEESLAGPAPKVPKSRAPKSARASSGPLTKAQFLAQLRPPLTMLGEENASRADVTKRIREETAEALRAQALPEGTKVSVTQRGNSIDVDVVKWPGQVFVNKYTEHLMDPKETPWTEDYRLRDSDKRDRDPRLTDDLNRAAVFIDKIRERHNFDRSDSQSDYFHVGYYGRTSTRAVQEAAEMGIKLEADKEFADLMRRGHDAARAVGPAATKSICGNADLRSADTSCIEHLIKIADRAKGRPVEYDKSRRGWYPVG